MLEAIGQGLALWLRNIPLLSALVLTVWLPGNIALNYVAFLNPTEELVGSDFWLPSVIDSIFGPLSLGAVIYALDRRWQGLHVGYFEALRGGLKNWIPLFFTLFVAELLVGLGCLLLIVPGIILAVRYAFVGIVVILENRQGSSARSRSSDLVRGRMLAVLGVAVLPYVPIMIFVGVLYVPLDLVYESTSMTELQYYGLATCLDCFTDILFMSIIAMLFVCYVHITDRKPEALVRDYTDPQNSAAPLVDDGNPYRPPSV